MIYILFPLLIAIINRLRGAGRGGWIGPRITKIYPYWGVQHGRALMGIFLPMPFLWAGHELTYLTSALMTFFLFQPGWGRWQNVYDRCQFIMMSLRGFLITAPISIVAMSGPYDAFGMIYGVSGIGMGLCYLAARLAQSFLEFNAQYSNADSFHGKFYRKALAMIGDQLAIAEVLFGAWLGLAFLVSFY